MRGLSEQNDTFNANKFTLDKNDKKLLFIKAVTCYKLKPKMATLTSQSLEGQILQALNIVKLLFLKFDYVALILGLCIYM